MQPPDKPRDAATSFRTESHSNWASSKFGFKQFWLLAETMPGLHATQWFINAPVYPIRAVNMARIHTGRILFTCSVYGPWGFFTDKGLTYRYVIAGDHEKSLSYDTAAKTARFILPCSISVIISIIYHTHTPRAQPFYGPFPGPRGWAGARRELLDLMVQGKINRGKHTDHPARRHSIRTNQCPPPPSPVSGGVSC